MPASIVRRPFEVYAGGMGSHQVEPIASDGDCHPLLGTSIGRAVR